MSERSGETVAWLFWKLLSFLKSQSTRLCTTLRSIHITARNSYTICYTNQDGEEQYGLICYFLSLSHESVAIIHPLKPTTDFCYPRQLGNLHQCIVPVSLNTDICVVPIESLVCKCILIDLPSSKFVVKPPNRFIEIIYFVYTDSLLLWLPHSSK